MQRLRGKLPDLAEFECALVVNVMLSAICAALEEGRRIEIRDFGVFEVRHRRARIAHNPRTGELLAVRARPVPFFRAGRELQRRVNRP